MYAMISRELKNENRSGVFHRPPLFSIQTHENHITKRKEKNTYKLELVFQRENHEFLLQNQFMQ